MDPQQAQTDTMNVDQAVTLLVRDLPKPVQDFVLSDKRSAVTLELTQKYGLHVDTAGAFERAFIFMLLGISTPEEFVKSLQEAGLPPATIQGLANDVNEKVFMRLRASEEQGGVVPAPVAPIMPAVLPTVMPAPRPMPPPPPPNLPGIPTPHLQASSPAPVITPPAPPPATPPFTGTLPNETTEVRTMQTDMEMMKSGMHPGLVPAVSTTPTPPPAIPVQRAPVQPPAPVAPPTPPPPPPAPAPAPVSAPNTPALQSDSREALHQILKEYGVDPYREPVN